MRTCISFWSQSRKRMTSIHSPPLVLPPCVMFLDATVRTKLKFAFSSFLMKVLLSLDGVTVATGISAHVSPPEW